VGLLNRQSRPEDRPPFELHQKSASPQAALHALKLLSLVNPMLYRQSAVSNKALCRADRLWPLRSRAHSMGRLSAETLGFSLSTLIYLVGGSGALAVTPEPEVVLQVEVPTQYDDSEATIRNVSDLTEFLPPTKAYLRRGETISSLLAQQYGFGARNLPSLQVILLRQTLALNGVARAESFHPGDILIPSLPRRSLTEPNPWNALNDIPALARPASVAVEAEPPGAIIPDSNWKRTSTLRDGTKTTFVRLHVPLSYVPTLATKPYFNGSNVKVISQPVEITLAGEAGAVGTTHLALSPTQQTTIRALLRQGSHKSTVFVLDSGWPSEAAYRSSLEYMHRAVDTIRSQWNLPPAIRSKDPVFTPPVVDHCRRVAAALEELQGLDPDSKIEVVYVPLTREQGASAILQELVELAEVDALEPTRGDLPVPQDIRAAAAQWSKWVVERLPKVATADNIRTDNEILDAVLLLGDIMGEADGSFYFVSESRTVASNLYTSPFLRLRGASLSQRQVILGATFSLARRSISPKGAGTRDTSLP
jgi:hypothetical protein